MIDESKLKKIVDLTKELDLENMTALIDRLDNEMSDRFLPIVSYQYDQIRSQLLHRYSLNQVGAFKPWKGLTQAKQKEFFKAFRGAQDWLVSIGFQREKTSLLIMRLVCKSAYLGFDSLRFADVIKSLDCLGDLFAKSFPYYASDPEAVAMLQSQL